MRRLFRFPIRLAIAIIGFWVAGFVNFTRPWVLPESVADGVCSGNPIGVYRLLAQGADVNAKTPGWSFDGIPLFQYFDNTTCQKPFSDPLLEWVLLGHDADVRQETSSGYTLLMLAIEENSEANVNFLLAKGVDTNRQTRTGETALMAAARGTDITMIDNLLSHGANPNLQNQGGETAMMMAAGRGFTAAVGRLLEHGADPGIQDRQQQNAADYARTQWRRDVMSLLKEHSAQN